MGVKITIPEPALFSFDECAWFLNRNYDDCLHVIKENEIIKAVEVGGKPFLLRITSQNETLQIEILKGTPTKEDEVLLIAYITEWFDLNTAIEPFYKLLKKDKRLAYMSKEFEGLRLVGINDLFEALCWSIIGQQINLTFAYKLKRRLVEKYGTAIEYECELHYIFPASEILAKVTVEELRAMQFSGSKAKYLIGAAQAFASKELSREVLLALPSVEHQIEALTSLKGIGVWTANYALMKSLRVPGSIPHGDVGLLNALVNHGVIKDRSELKKIDALFRKYKGRESYLVFYLWRSLSVKQVKGVDLANIKSKHSPADKSLKAIRS
jgi:DNA-3-methyladenine glycosylase II